MLSLPSRSKDLCGNADVPSGSAARFGTSVLPWIVAVIVTTTLASGVYAEFNFHYPRMRTFSDVGHLDIINARGMERGGRFNIRHPRSRGDPHATPNVFNFDAFRGGAAALYTSDYQWRDFTLTQRDQNYAVEGYAGLYGVEASVFSIGDFVTEYDHGPPLVTDYRLSYTRQIDLSITSIAYTYYDWSNSATKLGTTGQGFNPPRDDGFPKGSQEIEVTSYWFNETIQDNGMNYMVGGDAQMRIDHWGFRGQGIVGIFTNQREQGVELLRPSGARVLASIIYNNKYYTVDDASITGSDFLLEMVWDLRSLRKDIIFGFGVEYYYPWSDDDFRDRMIFFGRIEVPLY